MNHPIESPGCVILLIDQSNAMDSLVQEETIEFGQQAKSKGVSIANAVNSILKQLSGGVDFDLSIVGYHTDDSGVSIAQSCWTGPLSGREFVSTQELAANPITVETRQRRIPDPSSFDGFRSEPIEVPVWYQSKTCGIAPQVLAFQTCREMLLKWSQTAGPNPGQALIIHLFGGGSGDGNPTKVIEELVSTPIGNVTPLLFQAHLCVARAVPPSLYCANRSFLSPGPPKDLFERCSPLGANHIAALKSFQVQISANARGMLYNAKMLDIVRFLSLVKAHVSSWPPRAAAVQLSAPINALPVPVDPAPETIVSNNLQTVLQESPVSESFPIENFPPGVVEKVALVAFVFDRSIDDPYASAPNNPCSRLQDQLNDWLGKIAKEATGQLSVAVVSYGTDSTGETEVLSSFGAGLTGQSVVIDSELEHGAIRVEEITQQLDNGIGGLITRTQKRPIFFELEPTSATDPTSALQTVSSLISNWCHQHPQACTPPVVLHLTHGSQPASVLEPAIEALRSLSVTSGPALLYHVIATDAPHTSSSYCEDDSQLTGEGLLAAFSVSSLLLGREQLMESNPSLVLPQSRGFVVNGKFTFLMDAIRNALAE